MGQRTHWASVPVLIACLFCWCLPGGAVWAQEVFRPEEDTLAHLWTGNAEDVRQQILKTSRLPGSDAVKSLAEGPVLVWVERCFYGTDNAYSSEETRYAVLRVIVANRTESELQIQKEKISLQVRGRTFAIGENLNLLRNMPLQIDWNDSGSVRPQSQLRTPSVIKIEPGKSAAFWCLFAGFEPIPTLPPMQLQIVPESGVACSLDLNAQQESRLGLSMFRLGPQQALTVLTVHGQLNRVNAPALARQIASIADQGGARFLIQWAPESRPSDDVLFHWLLSAGRTSESESPLQLLLPPLPPVRQLILAELPQGNGDIEDWDGQGKSMFDSAGEASVFALKEIYERVDPRVALQEIRTGHPWSKVAALRIAGSRLQPEAVPDLLELSKSTDAQIQRAAVLALGAQKDDAAQARLQDLVFNSSAETARTAFAALLMITTPDRRQLVLRLLNDDRLSIPGNELFALLADHYHPDWLEEIVKGVRHSDFHVRAQALVVLHQIGHPDLIEFCRRGLADSEEAVREQAFQILVDGMNREAEQAARDYALRRLKEGHLDDSILDFIERTRETQAAPALIAALKQSGESRHRLIDVIGMIGTSQHLEEVLDLMSSFNAEDQMAVLQLAGRMPVSLQIRLVRQAIDSNQAAVIYTSIEILKSIGTEDALEILDHILKKRSSRESVDVACVALGEIGTRGAVRKLREFQQQSGAAGRHQDFKAALQGLRVWRSRLPGFNFVESGYAHVSSNDDDGALKAFSMAILINPDLADAYSARGNVYLRQSEFKKAGEDFNRGFALDPFDGQAITGVAIVRAVDGNWQAAVELIEEKEPRFSRDMFFSYNTACVYSRCVESLKKSDVPDRDQHIAEFEKRALAKLKESLDIGFRDLNWMQRDPDLRAIQELPEFKKLVDGD